MTDLFSDSPSPSVLPSADRAHGRDAEHALVAALVLGQAEPADLSGRLAGRDFFDPAAGLIFDTILTAARAGRGTDAAGRFTQLPSMLRAAGELRSDGYPIRPLLDWLPTVSVPAHPQAWAALVVASALGRQVEAAGLRLRQAANAYGDLPWGAGRVLAVAAGQRAAVHSALMRWEELPAAWRHSIQLSPQGVPVPEVAHAEASLSGDELLVERELVAGVVAAPALLDQLRWLQPRDFADPATGQLFATVRQLHTERRPIDLVTVAASLPLSGPAEPTVGASTNGPTTPVPAEVVLEVCRSLQPHRVFPGMVPWLARQQLESSLLREADRTGLRLAALAATPVEVGGLGGPVLRQAVRELDEFTDESRRLEAAQRVAPASDDTGPGRSRSLRLAPEPEHVPALDVRPDAGLEASVEVDPSRPGREAPGRSVG
jgi:hypothetical protein